MDKRLLVVDDSPDIVEIVREHFSAMDFRVDSAGSGREALQFLDGGFQGVILLDFKLPDVDGLDLMDQIAVLAPDSKVIMITAHGSFGMAVEAIQTKGAFSVHGKTEVSFMERLSASVANAFMQLNLAMKVKSLEGEIGGRYAFSSIITQSRRLRAIFKMLNNVLDSKVAVVIQGESGTGKELVAKAIHFNGPRKEQPFVAINCAGIPDTLLESELFGYEKGAFTGAYARKQGKFEQANKGTIFLDEIGEMNLALQAKILRVLQEKSFERLGGNETVNVDVRVISATNKDLVKEVSEGRFREDLYYRLSVFPVSLPPLRDRREDIPLLAEHFLKKFAHEEGKPELDGFTQRAMERLLAYHYPGNVRQLENAISHAVVVSAGKKIDISDLPHYLAPQAAVSRSADGGFFDVGIEGLRSGRGQVLPMKVLEEMAITHALKVTNNNVSQAARLLGISRFTVYRRLKSLGFDEAE